MTKDHYILIYFDWIPPNGILSGEEWSITKKGNVFKLTNCKTTKKITKKEIINGIYWKNPDNEYISEEDLPDFITWEGYGWLVKNCFRYDISIGTDGTIPGLTKNYFIQFRDVLYDLLKKKENNV